MKASAALIDGEWVDVFKDPITDPGKRSKKGRLKLIKTHNGYKTVSHHDLGYATMDDVLETVFENGEIKRFQSLEAIRAIARNSTPVTQSHLDKVA